MSLDPRVSGLGCPEGAPCLELAEKVTPIPLLWTPPPHDLRPPVTRSSGSYHLLSPPPLPSAVRAPVSSLPPTPSTAAQKSILCSAVRVVILKWRTQQVLSLLTVFLCLPLIQPQKRTEHPLCAAGEAAVSKTKPALMKSSPF